MNVQIKNGWVIDPSQPLCAQHDLYLANGKIAAHGAAPAGFHADLVIDAQGQVVAPGLVDLAARLREPGQEYRATLESEMQAAVAGGVTSLACPPDTDPVLDEPGLVEMLKHRTQQLAQAQVYPVGALTVGLQGKQLTEMAELTEAGCKAFSHADAPLGDLQVLQRALQYAKTFDYPVWLRPQEATLAHGGVAHAGALASRMGLSGIPVSAETIALHTLFELIRQTQARVHLCRLSSAAGIELVRRAKAEGLPVTADVGIHHVHLTDMDIGYFDPQAKLMPPLREQRDRDAIHAGLRDGTIDAICSDHTPVDDDQKALPFGEAEAGATGLELLLPLSLKWGSQAQQGPAAWATALAPITHQAARILGLPAGTLQLGARADICIFDPHASWTVQPSELVSQGRNTPFLGYELQGRVTHTLVEGRIVFQRKQH
ncbi:dihydroorotase [Parvibium lacunae]|uniref:Dihydroorotase n=1 Tax=Parvibium lacunae TaxID=1888893 RepID=A0A368L5V0_9BURK|nr:dihydroorotase [Parvibium lacunae]RCS58520.1 dihydroorotase [Parvibium lacunae]